MEATTGPQVIELVNRTSFNLNAPSYKADIDRLELTDQNVVVTFTATGGPDLRHPSGSCLFDLASGDHVLPVSLVLDRESPGDYHGVFSFPRTLLPQAQLSFVYSCSLDYSAVPLPLPVSARRPDPSALLAEYVRGLPEAVRAELNPLERNPDAESLRLAEFLYDANKNVSALPGFGVPTLMTSDSPQFVYQPLPESTQISILKNHSYDYVTVGSRQILLVGTSNSAGVSQAQIEAALGLVKSLLPKVHDAMGVEFSYTYLHVSILANTVLNHGDGANLFLRSNRADSATIVAHELAHTFQTRAAPRWWREASADEVALMITGSATYDVQATGDRFGLSDAAPAAFNTQVANAVVMLSKAQQLMGRDNLVQALGDLNQHDVTGRQVVDSLLSHTPDSSKQAVRSLICTSVAGYCPAQ